MRAKVLLLSVLAGSTAALPGFRNSTTPSHHQSHTLLPTGSGGGGGNLPSTNSTSIHHPTTTESSRGSNGGGQISTVTDTITSTTFIPCSTPIGTQGGTTFFSTWLTTSVWETTTCFTTTVPTSNPTPVVTEQPVLPTGSGVPGGGANCIIPPPVTSTVTVTVGSGGNGNGPTVTQKPGSGGGSGPCERCETVTFTNTQGHITTIVIPPFTVEPESTTTPTGPATSANTTVPTTTSKRPIGTGTFPSHTRAPASGNSSSGTHGGRLPLESRAWHLAGKF
ncbi:hypothetical protein BDV59DRAFT_181080 [Aspergillus ambiguus]|uniref:extracellular proline-rich protein n=1 Tax=Aspergillus ambiguus TaxID=176160 RepID=UPI003CCD5AD7